MAAARAFAARNPGQPLSVVFFNAQADRRAAAHDRPQRRSQAVLAKAPTLAEGTHIYDALAAAVAQVRGSALGAARDRAPLRRRRRRQRHEPRRRPRAARRRRRSASTRSASSRPTSQSDDLEKIAERDRRHVRRRELARGAHEDLRRARLPARQRVPAPLPLAAQPDQDVDVDVTVVGAEPVAFSYTTPAHRDARRRTSPRSSDKLLQSPVADPARRRAHARRSPSSRSGRSCEPPRRTRRSSPASASSSRCPPRSRPRERRKEVDAAPRRRRARRSSASGTSAGWRASREDVDVAQIKHAADAACSGSPCSPGSLLGARRSRCSSARSGSSCASRRRSR